MLGPVHLAIHADDLALDLENLAAVATDGFQAVSVKMKALCNVALQNRLVLTAQTGVCHIIIGGKFCISIPDISDNRIHAVPHLNALLQTQQDCDSYESWEFDIWAWLTSRSWYSVLMKVCTPVLIILSVFFCSVLLCDSLFM